MIDIEVDSMDIDTDGMLEELADAYADQIEQGGIDCPSDGCDSEAFNAELWTTDAGGLEGAAVCRECNSRIDLDLEDSDVKEGLKEIEDSLSNIF
ncbi:hypothetical protein [Haloterrigena salinisoli]|uniref:hypothetical protein n=1 Tax=Haloterrigena salinisoli TaxID=3132747 RepID=UPI0030CCFEF3